MREFLWRALLAEGGVSPERAPKRRGQCQIGDIQIAGQLMVGKLLSSGHSFESVRRRVFGKKLLQGDVDAEQIMNGVLILRAREPTASDSTTIRDIGSVRRQQGTRW